MAEFTRPKRSTLLARIRADINSRLPTVDAFIPASLVSVLGDVLAGAVDDLHGYLRWLGRQAFPWSATDATAVRWAGLFGLTRLQPSRATGSISLTGANGTVIPSGARFRRVDQVEVTTTAAATISGGVATVAVQAAELGAAGNALAGAVMTIVSPISGLDSSAAVAVGGLTGGADVEAIAALVARTLARIAETPQGGATADYVAWSKAVAGVAAVWVTSEDGAGTVRVRFAVTGSGSGRVPSSAKRDEVAAAIALVKPVTAIVTVTAPEADAHTIGVTLDAGADEAAVTAALVALFDEKGGPGQTIRNSWIREAISTAAGESWHTVTNIDGDGTGLSDVVGGINEIPTITPTYT